MLLILSGCATAPELVVPGTHATIQQAIDDAGPGDTVRVRAGVYHERLTFKDGINLVGEGRDRVTIRCDAEEGPVLVATDCQEGTISGLTLEHAGVEDLAMKKEDRPNIIELKSSSVEVSGCIVRGSAGNGILVEGEGSPVVRDCVITQNTLNGIVAAGVGCTPTIEDNQCSENKGNGIYVCEAANATAARNTCSKNEWCGISLADEETFATLVNNRCTENKRSGLCFGEGTDGIVDGGVIKNNREIDKGEIARLLECEQFDILEVIASELRAGRKRFQSGEWQLRIFYRWLGNASEEFNYKNKEKYLDLLGRWQEAHPDSVTVRIALAHAYRMSGWDARGVGWARDITSERWTGLRENMTEAWNILQEAEKLETKDPELYSAMINVAMGMKRDKPGFITSVLSAAVGRNLHKDKKTRSFEKGIAIEPAYHNLYYDRAHTLLPDWGGRPGEVELLAARAVELTRDTEGESLYAVIAHYVLRYGTPSKFIQRFHFSWPRIKQGHLDLLERFPKSSYRHNTFCRLACVYREKEIARELFEKIGDDWNETAWRSKSVFDRWKKWACEDGEWPAGGPLHYAASYGSVGAAERLLKRGEDINATDEYRRTPLYKAVVDNQPRVVRLLMQHGADPNLSSDNGNAALHVAAEYGRLELAKLLIEKGAEVDAVGYAKRTPLYVAVRYNRPALLELFLDHGADVNVATYNDWPPLMQACENQNVGIVRLLLRNGADPNQSNSATWFPLMQACDKQDVALVRILLRNGADPNQSNSATWFPLMQACEKQNTEIVRILLRNGADVNQQLSGGWSALHMAEKHASVEILKILLEEENVNVNITADEGCTPLHHAAENGHDEIIELLLSNGAEINLRDQEGRTPLARAIEEEKSLTVELLRKHGGVE
jgi:parallel beta-helix repeat protein